MKILFVTPSYEPYTGGVEHVVDQMSKGMSMIGCNVLVLTLATHPSLLRNERKQGVMIKRIFGVAPSNAYYLPSPSLIVELLKNSWDIIHVHAVHSLTAPISVFVALLKAKMGRKRTFIVLTPHYHDTGFSWHTRLVWFFYRPFLKLVMRSANIVHSISRQEADLIKRRYGISPFVLEHGVSEDVMLYDWSPPEVLTVTYAGRLEKYKRVDLLIHAMKNVSSVFPQAKLQIIGSGSCKGRLVKIARDNNVKVTFAEFLPRKEYLERLSRSSIVASLSNSESFGITIFEALAMGVPAITVKPWGETFERYPMCRVLPGNPRVEEVSDAILSLAFLEHRRKPEVLTWTEVCDRLYKEVYVQALKNQARRKASDQSARLDHSLRSLETEH